MKKEHILVIRFSAMGDVAMVVPVVYSLAQQYPHVRITVLSRTFARPLFEDLAPNVNFMAADLKHEYHGIKGLNTLYRRLVANSLLLLPTCIMCCDQNTCDFALTLVITELNTSISTGKGVDASLQNARSILSSSPLLSRTM